MKTITAFMANDNSLHQTRGRAGTANLVQMFRSLLIPLTDEHAKMLVQSRMHLMHILREIDGDVSEDQPK